MPPTSSDPGRDSPKRLAARELVLAGVNRAAHVEVMRLDHVVETEADSAVLANPDRRDGIVRLGTLEAVHRNLQVDRQSQMSDHLGGDSGHQWPPVSRGAAFS